MKNGKFTGRVVQRELAMITNLMTEENFAHLPPSQQFNVTAARVWYEVLWHTANVVFLHSNKTVLLSMGLGDGFF